MDELPRPLRPITAFLWKTMMVLAVLAAVAIGFGWLRR
jgi:hypothetical protein